MYNLPRPLLFKREITKTFSTSILQIKNYEVVKDILTVCFSQKKDTSLTNFYDDYLEEFKKDKKKLEYFEFRDKIILLFESNKQNETDNILDKYLKNEVFFPVWESLFKQFY